KDYRCIPLRPRYIQFMNKSTTKFISISQAIKKAWVNKGIVEEKNTVIYNGIDISKFVPRQQSIDCDLLKIVFTGSLSPSKGQIQLIKAIGLLPNEIKRKTVLDIYG